jgi:tetratricopeptide (TPR) repeat protein
MLRRFAASKDLDTVAVVCRACTLADGVGVSPDLVERVLKPDYGSQAARNRDLARRNLDQDLRRVLRQPDYWRSLGAVSYRAGKFAAALDAFQRAEKLPAKEDPWTWLFMALCHQRLGQGLEARAQLHKAADWINAARKTPGPGTTRASAWESLPWDMRVVLETLRGEAQSLIDPGPAGPKK